MLKKLHVAIALAVVGTYAAQTLAWQCLDVQQARLDTVSSANASFFTQEGFARAVAIEGNIAVVGFPADSGSPGAVYVYEFDGSTWVELQELIAPGILDGSLDFGWSVAISGPRIVVGTRGETNVGLWA